MTYKIVKKQVRLLKNAKNLLDVRREEYSIWWTNKNFYLKNPKNLTSFNKCIKNGASKNRKSVRKVSKTRSSNDI